MSAVLVEVGRKIVKKHAHISPLVRIPCTQSRPFLVIFLVLFSVIIVVAFTGKLKIIIQILDCLIRFKHGTVIARWGGSG